eukprot:5087414-Pleurochrysis_carterae.AAC.2
MERHQVQQPALQLHPLPSQSYKGRDFDGREMSRKVRFNADFPVFVEPFHYDIRERFPTAAMPGTNDVGPVPLRSVEDTLDDALLAAGNEDAFADLDYSDSSDSYSPTYFDGQAQVSKASSATRIHFSDAAFGLFNLGPAPTPLPS